MTMQTMRKKSQIGINSSGATVVVMLVPVVKEFRTPNAIMF